MRTRRHRYRVRAAVAVLGLSGAMLTGMTGTASAAPAVPQVRLSTGQRLADGISYRGFSVTASHGTVYGHLLTADLSDRHVSVGLLQPGAVAARAPLSRMADAAGAVAGVNGDFFDISESQHPGVAATGAAVGPAIADGEQVKAAVPDAQRFGPALPPGDSDEDVIGVARDGVARLDRIRLKGSVESPAGSWALRGYNQYALPVGGIGLFTSRWGSVSRERAVCGSDHARGDGCSGDVYEVAVRNGEVVSRSDEPGSGAIPAGTEILLGREGGADQLRRLDVGDRVTVRHQLSAGGGSPLRFAVGGFPVLRGGAPLAGLDASVAATRTAAGFGSGGHRMYLLALDGSAEYGAGLTLKELAAVMRQVGSVAAVDLDGGGSTTLVSRSPGSGGVTVRNHPSGGAERPVPEGIGLFSR